MWLHGTDKVDLCLSRMILAVAVCLAYAVSPAVAQVHRGQTWVASTGSVDEETTSQYQFVGADVFVRSSLASGHVLLRYNLVPTPELSTPHDPGLNCWSMAVDFLDNGSTARVQVNLYEQNLFTGTKKVLMSFDSNKFPSSTSFRKSVLPGCNVATIPDFSFVSEGGVAVYYIDAYLTKSGPGGTPGLRANG